MSGKDSPAPPPTGGGFMGSSSNQEVDYAALGSALAEACPAANAMSNIRVKSLKAKIYNLFPGVPQAEVDFAVATYFVLNDPSPKTVWGTAHPIVAGGRTVPVTAIVGSKGFIPVEDASGSLRKFLSGAYEHLVPLVIKHVPTVGPMLNVRLSERNLVGCEPIAAVSWVRTGAAEVGGATKARAAFKSRSIAHRGGDSGISVPQEESYTPPPPPARAGGSAQTFY